jgi:hypothetical protein
MVALMNRKQPPITLKVSMLEPSVCRDQLIAIMAQARPQRNLKDDQRSALLTAMNAKTEPLMLRLALDTCLILPGYATVTDCK